MLVVAFNQALILREEEDGEFAKRKATGKLSAKKSWWKFWEMYGEEEKEKTQTEHWKDIYNEPIEEVEEVKTSTKKSEPTQKGGVSPQ